MRSSDALSAAYRRYTVPFAGPQLELRHSGVVNNRSINEEIAWQMAFTMAGNNCPERWRSGNWTFAAIATAVHISKSVISENPEYFEKSDILHESPSLIEAMFWR